MSDISNVVIPSQEQQGANGQQYYSRQQMAAMFVARVRELGDEWINQPETSEEEKIHGVLTDVLAMIDNGDIANGIHAMKLAPQTDDMLSEEEDAVLPFPIMRHNADISGQLATMYHDTDFYAMGTELSEQYTNNIGGYLAQFNNTTGDAAEVDAPPAGQQVL